MKTSKPVSTISYNTSAFLDAQLAELEQEGIIEFSCRIWHQPEEDETKGHWHLYLQPAQRIQTEDIRLALTELPLPQKDALATENKPLRCMPFRSSKWSDWYLYGIHDPDYLASKGETRKYHYRKEDMLSSDADYFDELVRSVHHEDAPAIVKMKNALQAGETWSQFLARGAVPPSQVNGYCQIWFALDAQMQIEQHTYRACYLGHEEHSEVAENPALKTDFKPLDTQIQRIDEYFKKGE